jgi:uncharacterized protein (TIGR00251 family)
MNGEPVPWYRWQEEDLVLLLRVQPRAARDQWVAPHGPAYKVRITAPPVEGRANEHLCRFLAEAFDVPCSQVTLEGGGRTRTKRVRIRGPRRFPIPIERCRG